MILYIKNHKFKYEIENLIRIFFPNEKITILDYNDKVVLEDNYVFTELVDFMDNKYQLKVKVKFGLFEKSLSDFVDKDFKNVNLECERIFAVMLFDIFNEFTGKTPPWGILSGVRPVKLMRNMINEAGSESALKYFKEKFLVQPEKIDKCKSVFLKQKRIIELNKKESFSLYIAIPFCPTRCSYCSFVSHSIEKTNKLIPLYLELLLKEISYTGKVVKNLGLRLESVYIGGGTPTTLNANQLETLIKFIYSNFDMNTCREFTVEAGRPDTITDDKLRALKDAGITRISINPQTFNDNTLKTIGRKHTIKDTILAYDLAIRYGFKNINMDLIAGLPGEVYEDFFNSINKVCELDPTNITIHTLCIKRASRLKFLDKEIKVDEEQITEKMLNFSDFELLKNGYQPYYLYRQSKMVGNLENTGFSKPGFENFYNIFIMEELHSIISCGASSITKLKNPYNGSIERVCNFKFAYEYIDRFDEIISRKDKVLKFYEEVNK